MIKLIVLVIVLALSGVNCQRRILGGPRKVNLEDSRELEKVNKLAKFAVYEITSSRKAVNGNLALNLKLIRVVEASTQIVAGRNYIIKLRMKDSSCRLGCGIEVCTVKIFQALDNSTKLTESKCQSQRREKMYAALGGQQNVPVDRDDVVNAVNYAVKDANGRSEKNNFFKLFKISSAKHQVVSGFNYFVKFTVGETNCTKLLAFDAPETCFYLENASKNTVECNATILDQPWGSTRYTITRSECVL
jgi:hypothetical protein